MAIPDKFDITVRDHGLGTGGVEPVGVPRIKSGPLDDRCPNCEGRTVFEIEHDATGEILTTHDATGEILTTGKGIMLYLGCAACPWASPALTRAV